MCFYKVFNLFFFKDHNNIRTNILTAVIIYTGLIHMSAATLLILGHSQHHLREPCSHSYGLNKRNKISSSSAKDLVCE